MLLYFVKNPSKPKNRARDIMLLLNSSCILLTGVGKCPDSLKDARNKKVSCFFTKEFY